MSDFVEQCRREWRRLRVPDPVAEEMAADLAADLREAEAEGVSAEELLGSSVFDPRSFAASWAAERGIIPQAPQRETASRRPLALLALATVFAIALIVGALALLTLHSRVAAIASTPAPPHLPSPPSAPDLGPLAVHGGPVAATAVAWILILLAIAALVLAAWSMWLRSRLPTTTSA
jgi:hypothetical protein